MATVSIFKKTVNMVQYKSILHYQTMYSYQVKEIFQNKFY